MQIGIFGYNFLHEKTIKIIKNTHKNGFNIAAVWLAPKKNLDTKAKVLATDLNFNNDEVISFCNQNSIPFFILNHDNLEAIRLHINKYKINIGLIAGARIIKKDIIKLFSLGIVNYHPGKIPETSGLNSLHYSIKLNIPPIITAHIIDHRVDAGKLILEKRVSFCLKDDLVSIQKKIIQEQIKINQTVLSGINKGIFSLPIIIRPTKNKILSIKEKLEIELDFSNWKKRWAYEE